METSQTKQPSITSVAYRSGKFLGAPTLIAYQPRSADVPQCLQLVDVTTHTNTRVTVSEPELLLSYVVIY